VSPDGEVRGSRVGRGLTRRLLVAVPLPVIAFGVAATTAAALASATYNDPAGDTNAAPDIVSVAVDDSVAGRMKVRIHVDNFATLPPSSRINLELDLDRNANTGVTGNELVARYPDTGVLDVLRWDGIRLSPSSTEGIVATLAGGVLEFDFALSALAGSATFALRASSQTTQDFGGGNVTATDFAPTSGKSVYASAGAASFADPKGDHDAAPDITSMTVSDNAAGIVTVRLGIPNYETLAADKVIGFGFDLAGRPTSIDDVFAAFYAGANRTEVDWEEGGSLVPSPLASASTSSFANGVLTMSIPRRELDGAGSFGFSGLSLDVVGQGEGEGDQFEGEVEALDAAPDDIAGTLPTYKLANPGPLRLRASAFAAKPARPKANRTFVWSMVVRRLDTYQPVRSGTVTCSARASGKAIKAKGKIVRGRVQCSALVPKRTASRLFRGSIAVKTGGTSVRVPFSVAIR
jgi:hypothetical protein